MIIYSLITTNIKNLKNYNLMAISIDFNIVIDGIIDIKLY